jgi:RNA polymerase sigma-70 factor (ECF subfamily)
MTAEAPLSELARRASRHDEAAFEALASRLQPSLYGFARNLLRDPFEANDLCQEILLLLYRKLGLYDERRPFEPWFWRLATNAGRNYLRRRPPVPVDQLERPGPEEQMPDRPQADRLEVAISELRPGYRRVILLRYYEDRTLREIAAATGGSEPAVRSRLHRARSALSLAMRAPG